MMLDFEGDILLVVLQHLDVFNKLVKLLAVEFVLEHWLVHWLVTFSAHGCQFLCTNLCQYLLLLLLSQRVVIHL